MSDTPRLVVFKPHDDAGMADYVIGEWDNNPPIPDVGDTVSPTDGGDVYVVRSRWFMTYAERSDPRYLVFCYVVPIDA